MKRKTKKETVKPINVFFCCNNEFSPAEMKQHLIDAHKITEAKGTKSMLEHWDCKDSYASTWEWKIGDLTFTQETVNPRSANDPMRWA